MAADFEPAHAAKAKLQEQWEGGALSGWQPTNGLFLITQSSQQWLTQFMLVLRHEVCATAGKAQAAG